MPTGIWRSVRTCSRWASSNLAGCEYEWRNLTEAGKATLPKMTSAAWNGMRIPNGRLLMVGDQGYGDTIQFARYIPMVADRCQELILGCSAEMGPLLPGSPRRCAVLPPLDRRAGSRRALPAVQRARTASHDGSRPSRPRCRTCSRTRPASQPGDKAGRNAAAGHAAASGWPGPAGRRIRMIGAARMPLARLAPLATPGRASFVSLQKPMPAADAGALASSPG